MDQGEGLAHGMLEGYAPAAGLFCETLRQGQQPHPALTLLQARLAVPLFFCGVRLHVNLRGTRLSQCEVCPDGRL